MNFFSNSMTATMTCTKSGTAGAIIGLTFILAIVGAVVFLALANARARSGLAAANAELNYLRPENARLRQWLSTYTGIQMNTAGPNGSPPEAPTPAQWYADPRGRHELRYWNGTHWTDDVWDQGVMSADPRN
jgi:hypothetical protein